MLILASVLTDEDGNPNGVCSLLWLIALVFAICFSVLFIKASKQEASSKKNDTRLQANLEVVPAELKDDQIQARGEEKRKMVIDSTKTSKIQTEGYSNPSEFIALDLETPNTNNNSVSSISFVHVRDGEVIHKVSELLNPEQDFAAVNTQITGINSLMVKDKRKFPDFWRECGKEITSFPIVGHNVRFDIVVICKCLKHYGFTLNEVQYIDTMEMARDYLVLGNFGLDSICQALKIPPCPSSQFVG